MLACVALYSRPLLDFLVTVVESTTAKYLFHFCMSLWFTLLSKKLGNLQLPLIAHSIQGEKRSG